MATQRMYSFFLRRLHSLTGVLPIGAFLVEHFFTNSFAMFGPEVYNSKIEFFMGLPYILLIEIGLIWVPILFHGLYGMYIVCTGQVNAGSYCFMRNWMYLLQRISGAVALIFIVYHVYATRISGLLTGQHVTFEQVHQSLQNPLILAFYILGIVSASYHLGNGLFGFLITWGIAIGDKTQRAVSVFCGMVSVGMGVFGLAALRYFV
ncbi:MAG: succinate dehydrogenase [Deltaproteobacteria bacterium]|nr:succinate dehydrogenase [Deltaproteobacteria bacterium]TLN04512.1 MAG: succinate dehydrogenase [bacterium]